MPLSKFLAFGFGAARLRGGVPCLLSLIFSHVLPVLRLAVPVITFFVVDLGIQVHPDHAFAGWWLKGGFSCVRTALRGCLLLGGTTLIRCSCCLRCRGAGLRRLR